MTGQRVIFIIAWVAQERSGERERDPKQVIELPTSAYLYFSEMLQVSVSVFRQKHMCSVWNIFLLPVVTPATYTNSIYTLILKLSYIYTAGFWLIKIRIRFLIGVWCFSVYKVYISFYGGFVDGIQTRNLLIL